MIEALVGSWRWGDELDRDFLLRWRIEVRGIVQGRGSGPGSINTRPGAGRPAPSLRITGMSTGYWRCPFERRRRLASTVPILHPVNPFNGKGE
jgi:hypothetical protein